VPDPLFSKLDNLCTTAARSRAAIVVRFADPNAQNDALPNEKSGTPAHEQQRKFLARTHLPDVAPKAPDAKLIKRPAPGSSAPVAAGNNLNFPESTHPAPTPGRRPMSRARCALLLALLAACGLASPPRARAADDKPKADASDSDSKDSGDKDAGKKKDDAKKSDDKKDDKKDEEPKPSVTHSTVTIDGKLVAYTATAGKMLMATDEGEPKAHVFFVAYTVDDGASDDESKPSAKRTRPITYCFNGGPGSSSVWLHLGMLGPVKLKLDSDAGTLPPPHELIANPYSLLDVTDLVFIDPVSTGFSRPAKGENKDQFHGYEQDLRSVAQFIHEYTTKYARWGSPKFLLGESYGGVRAAGLSGELRDRYHLELNGLVIISGVIDFQTLAAGGHNDVAYAMFLPTYAATAWYHKALREEQQDQSLDELVKQAEEFAAGPYLEALTAGDALPKNRRRRVIRRMAELTGLSEDYLDAANLRVSMGQFGKELLRKRSRVIGRYDSRYEGIDRNTLGERAEQDPSAEAVFGTFTSALNDYLRTTLKVDEPRVYEILSDKVHPWDFSSFTNEYVDASETLRQAMTQNPFLNVYAACGYYDLATPQFAMKYTRDHLGLAPEVRDHFTMGYYEAGHMMYVHEPSLKKLRKELLKFYETTLHPKEKE
jgi:carboxypeptidase C (cathepsin A)